MTSVIGQNLNYKEVLLNISNGRNLLKQQKANYSRLLKNINSPQIFKLAKEYHISNGEKNSPHGEFNFTEGWFSWRRSKVCDYSNLLNNIVTQVLDIARKHQKGRVTKDVTHVTFNFTEGWFRTVGIEVK